MSCTNCSALQPIFVFKLALRSCMNQFICDVLLQFCMGPLSLTIYHDTKQGKCFGWEFTMHFGNHTASAACHLVEKRRTHNAACSNWWRHRRHTQRISGNDFVSETWSGRPWQGPGQLMLFPARSGNDASSENRGCTTVVVQQMAKSAQFLNVVARDLTLWPRLDI